MHAPWRPDGGGVYFVTIGSVRPGPIRRVALCPVCVFVFVCVCACATMHMSIELECCSFFPPLLFFLLFFKEKKTLQCCVKMHVLHRTQIQEWETSEQASTKERTAIRTERACKRLAGIILTVITIMRKQPTDPHGTLIENIKFKNKINFN